MDKLKSEAMILKDGLHDIIADEACQQLLGGRAREAGQAAATVEREGTLLLQVVEQLALVFGERQQLALPVTALLPDTQMHRCSEDILIGHTQVGPKLSLLILGIDRLIGAFRNLYNEYGASLYPIALGREAYRGLAIECGCSFYHIGLLFRTDTGYAPVILHSYKQPPSLRVGKCRECLGNLACIGNLEFEILPDMFAFSDQ